MFVLSRKVGERIVIGEHVEVTVVRIGPNSVRLGIQAPKYMIVLREELGEQVSADYHEVDLPLDGVIVPALFNGCGDCREPALDCNCVVADA
ncbi:MAG: carbon storage regulator [Planctomycetaceae bacterium]